MDPISEAEEPLPSASNSAEQLELPSGAPSPEPSPESTPEAPNEASAEASATPPEPVSAETPASAAEPSADGETGEPAPAAEAGDESEEAAPTPSPAAEGDAPLDPLAELADRATAGRLNAADEAKAQTLLKEALLDGRKGVERAVLQLPKLPWIVCVGAVSAVWSEMKTVYHARLIGGLAKIQTEAARRVRLSLSRGLFKQDVPAAMKLAIGVAKEIRDKENGAVTPKNAQIFANVFIGRAKPWIAQVPLANLKPIEADLLVHCALMSVFGLPHAPATQLGVLKWAAAAGRLVKLHPAASELLLKNIGRWSAKWQNALRKEVPELPEEIVAVLKAPTPEPEPPRAKEEKSRNQPRDRRGRPERDEVENEDKDKEEEAGDDNDEDKEDERDEREREAKERDEDERDDDEEDEDEDDDDEDSDSAEGEAAAAPSAPPQPKPRPVYESKTIPSGPHSHQPQNPQQQRRSLPNNFNVTESLRHIEAYVASLRTDLQATQSKLRQKEDESRKARRPGNERPSGVVIAGEPTFEELARLNRQLELRNAELQEYIQELKTDSEDRAASQGPPEAPEAPDASLRTLLCLKLQEDFEDFLALEKEEPDIVVQQHYRTVLRHVFEVLRTEGVKLRTP